MQYPRQAQKQGNEETPNPYDKAGIRVTDVALVHHSDREWRTESKRLSVNSDVVEWNRPIPMRIATGVPLAQVLTGSSGPHRSICHRLSCNLCIIRIPTCTE